MKSLFSKTSLVAVVALVALSLILVGCGAKAEEPTGTEATTVKIGVGAPLTGTGVVAFGQGAVRVTKMAAEEFNASDRAKELGIKFEVVEGDDQGDPKAGVAVANQFAADAELVGVVGHINSGVAIPASKVYNDARITMITPSATNPTLTQQGFDNIFRTCTIDPVQGSAAADSAFKDLGLKNAFVVDDSTDYGTGLADFFAEQFEKNGGAIAGREKTSDKDSDFTALATKIKASGADAVFYGGLYNAGALFVKQLRSAGVDVAFIGGDGLPDAEFVKIAGVDAAANCYATAIGLPLEEMDGGPEWQAKFAETYPGEENAATDAYSYDAAVALMTAVLDAADEVGADKITGAEGREAIIAAMAALDIESLTGNISFQENGDSNNLAVTLKVTDGEEWVRFVK